MMSEEIPEYKKEHGGQPGNKNAEKWTEERAVALGEELIVWLKPLMENGKDKHAANIFINDFLTIHKGVYKDLVDYLSDKFTSFSELKKRAFEIQETKLIKFGTANKLNPTMTIFVLKNKHGYSDRYKHEINPTMPFNINISRRE